MGLRLGLILVSTVAFSALLWDGRPITLALLVTVGTVVIFAASFFVMRVVERSLELAAIDSMDLLPFRRAEYRLEIDRRDGAGWLGTITLMSGLFTGIFAWEAVAHPDLQAIAGLVAFLTLTAMFARRLGALLRDTDGERVTREPVEEP